MNGICSRHLLDNAESIFEEIQRLTLEQLKMKKDNNDKDVEILTTPLDGIISLFEIIDLVFSTLRILDLSPVEIEVAEKGILKLEEMWRKLDSSITSKCHMLFKHTIK